MGKGSTPHPRKIKEKAVAMLCTESMVEVSKKMGIPMSTLHRWKRERGVEIRDTFEEVKKIEVEKHVNKMEEFINEAWKVTINSVKLLNKKVEKATNDLGEIDSLCAFILEHKKEVLNDAGFGNQEIVELFNKLRGLEVIRVGEISSVMGTAFDKYQLASGGATERVDITSFEQYPE